MFRLCGKANDIIQMTNGVFYLNGQNFDSYINLINQYKISKEDYTHIEEKNINNDEYNPTDIKPDSVTLLLEKEYLVKKNIKALLKIDTLNQNNIMKYYPYWTIDNFGPIKVPKDSVFLLGDNRHNANDSRYIGFIPKQDIIGTVLFK